MKNIILIIILSILFGLLVFAEEENIEIENPINFSNEDTTLLWHRNIEYTLGYNLGFCCRGAQLNNSPSTFSLDIIKLIAGVTYWLHSIESGIRFPINNRVFELGLGYGWANIGSGNFGVRFPNTLVNNTITNHANFCFDDVNKHYIYAGYIINPFMCGLELNYSRGYGTEFYYPYIYPNSIIDNIRRDFIGGGIYFKLSDTDKNFKKIKLNRYLIFKIAGSYEIHNTSPYSELWNKKLTIWYTGLYAGFNFNIGGRK